jgi:hypothetical protein
MRAVEEDPAAERLGAVLEADQAGAAGEVGVPAAVVANRDAQGTSDGLDLDGGFRGVRVLRCVRQRLRHDVIRGRLDRLGQPPVERGR